MSGTDSAWSTVGDPGPAVRCGPLEDATTADVCVIGLGASGLAAAQHAAERGAEVVALDAVGIGGGAAGRNGGFLLGGGARFHHDAVRAWGRQVAVWLYQVTLEELDRTQQAHPDAVRRVGSLRIAASDDELRDCRDQLAAMQADGLAAEPYDGPEGRGLLVPDDAAFQPLRRLHEQAQRAVTAGARLHAPAVVTGITAGEVRTDAAVVRAHRVVVAVDGGLERLLPELAARVRSARLQMLATGADPGVSLPRPVYRRWGLDYVQQLPTGEILLGGGRDVEGDGAWDAPPVTTEDVQRHLEDELRRLGATAAVTHRWAARSAFTADRLPVCEEVRPGVLAVGAYSGHGNLLGTWCGRRAVDAALDGAPLRLLPPEFRPATRSVHA